MNNPAPSNPPPPRASHFFSWRTLRRLLLALAFLITIIALFYSEEDWRGKRAWEQCKRDLDAKGINYKWSSIIPPPVPDDQNFFKAPGIDANDWIGRGSRPLAKAIDQARGDDPTNNFLVAEVSIVPPGSPGALPVDDTNTPAQIRQSINKIIGPTLRSAHSYLFTANSVDQPQLAHFQFSSDKTPTAEEIGKLFPRYVAFIQYDEPQYSILVESSGSNSYRANLRSTPVSAADFLARTHSLEPTLDIVREALKRPYQRMDGDYSRSDLIPIPNFLTLRAIAQLLADRAKCHLLLHNPDEALRDILLLHDICLVTESRPAGRPMTLVASMIHVAIIGLYADTIADGFATHSWTEPNLIALQDQLARTDLLPFLINSFRDEPVFSAAALLDIPPRELYKDFSMGTPDKLRAHLADPLYWFVMFAPHGWLYQNVVFSFSLQPYDQTGDAARQLVFPEKAAQAQAEMEAVGDHAMSPYSVLIKIFRPNGIRAWQTLARQQTSVNEALIACVLERYRLARGAYPETLDGLIPQFTDKLPHDLIGGQPLHYRRQSTDTFLLYSVGWNETDDGGIIKDEDNGISSYDRGDWVWPNKAQY